MSEKKAPEEIRERKSQNTGEKNLRDKDAHTYYTSVYVTMRIDTLHRASNKLGKDDKNKI